MIMDFIEGEIHKAGMTKHSWSRLRPVVKKTAKSVMGTPDVMLNMMT